MALIYSTHNLHPKAVAGLAELGTFTIASALDPATLIAEAGPADILIVRALIPPALFAAAPKLRAALRHGAGVDMIPIEAATAAGVLVANAPGTNARSVAEHVLFVTLALIRRFRQIDGGLRRSGWLAARVFADDAGELFGKTIGLVGYGAIGAAVARIARDGFGMRVLATRRRPIDGIEGVEGCSLEETLSRSDVVVLACPLNEQTRGLIDARRLALLKPGAFLVNVSRGPVVDEDALIAALAAGRIGGAALDVFTTQPLAADHPLLGFDNVILTPHLAGLTDESMARMGLMIVEETRRILAGHLPVNFVNPEVATAYRKRFPGTTDNSAYAPGSTSVHLP